MTWSRRCPRPSIDSRARTRSAWSISIIPDIVLASRNESPLIIGKGEGENIVASDIPAVLEFTREIIVLHDGEIAIVSATGVEVIGLDGAVVEPEMMHVEWDLDAAEKGGYEDFMLKEIFEQPKAIRDTLLGRMGDDGLIQLSELQMTPEEIALMSRVYIIACGTSLHAGLVAKNLIEQWARIPVEVQCSSEFRYADPIVDDETLVVAITQSGETADTLAGVREARERGAKVIAITNVVGSRVTRESDGVIYTHAGPEIGVAATKTFTSQIAALTVLALKLAQAKGTLSSEKIDSLWRELATDPRHRRGGAAGPHRPRGVRAAVYRRVERSLPRPGHGGADRDGGRTQAQGDLLHPRRGVPRRRDEARAHRADHRPTPGHRRRDAGPHVREGREQHPRGARSGRPCHRGGYRGRRGHPPARGVRHAGSCDQRGALGDSDHDPAPAARRITSRS